MICPSDNIYEFYVFLSIRFDIANDPKENISEFVFTSNDVQSRFVYN